MTAHHATIIRSLRCTVAPDLILNPLIIDLDYDTCEKCGNVDWVDVHVCPRAVLRVYETLKLRLFQECSYIPSPCNEGVIYLSSYS